MAMPKKGHVRWVIYVKPEIKDSVQQEGKQRKMSAGDILTEAMCARMIMVKK